MCIRDLFFKFFGKYEKKKTEVTLSLILQFNLRLGGYSIWSASTSRTIYDQDFGSLSTSQPRSKRKYLKDYSTYLKEGPEATRRRF